MPTISTSQDKAYSAEALIAAIGPRETLQVVVPSCDPRWDVGCTPIPEINIPPGCSDCAESEAWDAFMRSYTQDLEAGRAVQLPETITIEDQVFDLAPPKSGAGLSYLQQR